MDYKLILIEGIDGSGKGVVIDTFKELIEKENLKTFNLKHFIREEKKFPEFEKIKDYDIILSAEPTYGWIGQAIRDELIKNNKRKYSALSVAHAYSLDRKILYKRLLIPALQSGKIIIQDRSVVSSIAYQPLQAQMQEEDLPLETVLDMPGNKLAVEDYPPSLIIITTLSPETAIQRLTNRDKQDDCIFERLEFQRKLQERYNSTWLRSLFEKHGTKVVYLDTNSSIEETKEQVIKIWNEHIKC